MVGGGGGGGVVVKVLVFYNDLILIMYEFALSFCRLVLRSCLQPTVWRRSNKKTNHINKYSAHSIVPSLIFTVLEASYIATEIQ